MVDRVQTSYRERQKERQEPVSVRHSRTIVDNSGRVLVPRGNSSKSPFQRVLDERSSTSDTLPLDSSSEVPQEVREKSASLQRPQEHPAETKNRFQEKLKEKEKEKQAEENSSSETKSSTLHHIKEADRRVVARGSVSERKGEGKGQGGTFNQFGGQFGKKEKNAPMWVQAKKTQGFAKEVKEEGKFSLEKLVGFSEQSLKMAALEKGMKPQGLKEIPKTVLDQIVQYCRLVIKTDGDKEFDIQVHEEIFKGLRLKVALVKGRIQTTFLTSSQEVKDLFEAHKSSLQESLSEKGIDVDAINVVIL